MSLASAHNALSSFTPTGDESTDVARLYEITDAINVDKIAAECVTEILAVFERHPDADLGSPGPLVHCIETVPMESFVPKIAKSLKRAPSLMTLWMADRCLRSNPTTDQAAVLVAAIKTIANFDGASSDLKSEATLTLS